MPKKKDTERLQGREGGFNLNNLGAYRLPEYNALFDPNMRHFFENKKLQQHLYRSGQIDRHGRCIDLDKNKSKVSILEKEFSGAELAEERRMKEELEMRYRVQRKRFNDLERQRKEEILEKLKMDRDLSKEIIQIMRATSSGALSLSRPSTNTFSHSSQRKSEALKNTGSFITEK